MEKQYCAAPWRGLHINLDGDVRVCCAGTPGFIGNINDQSVTEILQSPSLIELRRSIKSGTLHPRYCVSCIKNQSQGHTERDWHNHTNPDFDPSNIAENETHIPVILDIRWNNTCNLSCTYCGPYFSSSWGSISGIPVRSVNRKHFKELKVYVIDNKHHIKDLALLGGEPLLLSWNREVIEFLPDSTQITVITNLSVNLADNSIFQLLQQRSNVHWRISVENIETQFEYVRRQSHWELLNSNIGFLNNPKHRTGLHSIYNIYNCTRLVEFRSWAADKVNHVQWQAVSQSYLDPRFHCDRLKTQAIKEIDKLLDMDIAPDEIVFFQNILDTMESNKVDLSNQFASHVWRDENNFFISSHLKFQDLWPELAWMIHGK